jgi:ribosomal protein S18 acetylase RimI-like enzyme
MERAEETQGVVLRVADVEDRPRADAVRWSVGWADAPERHQQWPEADADWVARRYFREILAEVDGVVAARIGLEAYRPPFAQLVDLSVRPAYRRRGLGRLLTRACETEAARRGFRAVFLQTELDNAPAHHLYSSLGFVPTAYGKMLRLVKFLDYPLIEDFRRGHPLNQYWCTAVKDAPRCWDLEWHAYITEDYLRLRMESGSSQSDSEGMGPALTGLSWRVGQGARGINLRLQSEAVRDLEPGNYVELSMTLENTGGRMESGVFQMILPPGVLMHSPATNRTRSFSWQAAPGETVTQPVTLQIEPTFDASLLWYLNHGSLPVCLETYWERHRALLSSSLHLAIPPPSPGP